MKEFFKKVFFKGLKLILIFVIIWIIYFIINFINPDTFSFLRLQSKDKVATSTSQGQQTFGYRIYNLFFKSKSQKIDEDKDQATSTKGTKRDIWNATTTVWGGEPSTWGTTKINANSLVGRTFISPNIQRSPIIGMKINNLLINENSFNYFTDKAMIDGSIYTGFSDSYYFNAEIYDVNGDFLFLIPVISDHKFVSDDSFAYFYAQYDKNFNTINYKGKAYLVISSDNSDVTGSVILKIYLK